MMPSALPDGARQISQLHERFESSSAAKSTTKCVRFRSCEALVAWGIVRAKTGGGCQPWRRINGYDAESPKFRAWPLGVATLSAVFSSPLLTSPDCDLRIRGKNRGRRCKAYFAQFSLLYGNAPNRRWLMSSGSSVGGGASRRLPSTRASSND